MISTIGNHEKIMNFTCSICGKGFTSAYSLGSHVGHHNSGKRNNSRKIPLEERICECGCGETYECKANSEQRFIRGHNARKFSIETRICECGCGGMFECRENSTKRYIQGHNTKGRIHPQDCDCASCISKRGEYSRENAPNYRGGKIEITCEFCGEVKEIFPYREGNAKYCSKECANKDRIGKYCGPNSPSWRGGIAYLPYSFDFGPELKEFVRNRDNNTCYLCGKTKEEEGKNLAVHHIDYIKENSTPENLITLCCGCNSKVNWNREYWIGFFQEEMMLVKLGDFNVL